MYKIKTLNKIAKCGTDLFNKNFSVEETETPDGILVRSASLHDYDFDANKNLLAIARAGAGVNNIPLPTCCFQHPRSKRERSKRTRSLRTLPRFEKSCRRDKLGTDA